MALRVLKSLPILAAFGFICSAADDLKPVCNAQNYGRMWPEAANHDRKMVLELARCGSLEICSRPGIRYRWESLTVRIEQLGRNKKKPAAAPGCEEIVEQIAESSPAATK